MKILQHSLWTLALVLTSPLSVASDEGTVHLIEEVQKRLLLEEVVSGRFQQDKFIAVLPQPLRSEGRFSYNPGSGLDWETLSPIANRLLFNEQGIVHSVDGKVVWEVDASQPAVVTISQVMSSVLAMNWAVLQEYFILQGAVNESHWRLHLEPRDAVLKQIVEAIAIIGSGDVESLTLMEANGDRTEIRFFPLDALDP